MALLKLLAVSLALVVTPARAETVADWRPYIAEASLRFGIPAAWIERVMRAESNGQTRLNGRPIRSRAGAIGLMQLMPGTWEAIRRMLGLGADPDDPHDNILAGTFYLRMMYDRFGYPACSPPIMPAQRDMRFISPPAARCLARRLPTCRRLAEWQPTSLRRPSEQCATPCSLSSATDSHT